MLNEKQSYTSNKVEELEYLKGETIRGMIHQEGKKIILFNSGYALWFNSEGAFAIERHEWVEKLLDQHKGKLIATQKAIENVLKLAGELA
jgi:hypothetical protein